MNETNSTAIALQQLATHAGYSISGAEIGLIVSVGGAVVHIAHQAVGAWKTGGGWQGLKQFLNYGGNPPATK